MSIHRRGIRTYLTIHPELMARMRETCAAERTNLSGVVHAALCALYRVVLAPNEGVPDLRGRCRGKRIGPPPSYLPRRKNRTVAEARALLIASGPMRWRQLHKLGFERAQINTRYLRKLANGSWTVKDEDSGFVSELGGVS